MEGRYGFSEGFPEGKSEGWNGRPKACPPAGGGDRPSACHSIITTFPREIPRKTHTFPTLVNKNNILYSIVVIYHITLSK